MEQISKSELQFIMDNVIDIISKIDQKGCFLYISSSCKTLLGYTHSDLIGKNAFDYIHKDDQDKVQFLFAKGIETNHSQQVEYRFLHSSGHHVWLETTGNAVISANGNIEGVVLCSRDITKRKELEQKNNVSFDLSTISIEEKKTLIEAKNKQAANDNNRLNELNQLKLKLENEANTNNAIANRLEKRENQLSLITENINDVVWLISADNNIMEYISPSYEEVWGKSCDEIYKDPTDFLKSVYTEDSVSVSKAYEEYKVTGSFNMTYRIVRPNGEIRWIEAMSKAVKNSNAKIIGHIGRATDVTSIKNNEIEMEKLSLELYFKEKYISSIMETQNEMICRFLPDTTLTFVNKAYCKQLRHNENQLIGRKFLELIPETEHNHIMNHLKNLDINRPSISYIQQIYDDEGNEIWQEWIDTAIFNPNNEVVEYQGVGRDVTFNKMAEQKVFNSNELLQKTQKIANIGSYTIDLAEDTCQSSLFLNELLGIESSEIHPLDLWPTLIHKEDKDRVLRAHEEAIKTASDFDQNYRIIRKNDGIERWVNDIGTIELDKNGIPSKLIGTIMDITSRKILTDDLQLANRMLTEAYDSTIEGWAFALEMKEEETKEHSRRVTDLTICIANALKINEIDLIHIKRGAILHDIGKMAIPDSILLKPGKLNEREWEIMKKHPEYAFTMLSDIDYLKPAIEIPYCHHEKWDGTGYPRGLKREEIPLAARIFTVVDVYDALISERPYKKAWDKEKALKYIFENSGSHFDPEVVNVFKELVIN